MTLEIVRRLRGNVHGTIDVSSLEDAVISHETFQRLRRIRQLAFLSYVFPGGTHTRFEHSLGVLQLAGMAWDKLKVNQRRHAESVQAMANFTALEKKGKNKIIHGFLSPTFPMMNQIFESDYILQVLRLAGLLHDIGHPPFSHSGDRFAPSWEAVRKANPDIPDYLKDYLAQHIDGLRKKDKDPTKVKVRHEVFSLLMVEKILRETYEAFPDLKLQIDPRDIISVITPGIKPSSTSPLLAHGVYKMCNELIAGEIDVDRMDYLLRDSRECGVVYGIFDAGRILDGLSMYYDDVDKSLHVAINHSSIAAFEDYLRARQSMYLQVYFHKTSASAEAMLQYLARKLGGWTLPADVGAYAQCDEYNIGQLLEKAAETYLKDMYERKEFDKVMRDLLYRRRLWKMVFEYSSKADDPVRDESFEHVKNLIKEESVEFEEVTSTNYLTRFRGRQNNERSTNYLRLIRKDEFQCPRVVPIEDYSNIIQDNERFIVKRLYVEGGADVSGNSIPNRVKTKIFEDMQKMRGY